MALINKAVAVIPSDGAMKGRTNLSEFRGDGGLNRQRYSVESEPSYLCGVIAEVVAVGVQSVRLA